MPLKMNNLSNIIFGTWGLSEWKKYSEKYCSRLCNLAYDIGINSFDTAHVYGNGKSEKFLSALPKECFIATKIPSKNRSGNIEMAYELDWVKKCINLSMKRLKRDSLDLVQIHNWNYEWGTDNKLFDLMRNLKEEEIVKSWGVSLPFKPSDSNEAIFNEPLVDYFQIHYNLLQQQNRDLIRFLRQKNKKVILRSVLLHGFLLGSINPPFQKKYSENIKELAAKRNILFENSQNAKRLDYCIMDAFSKEADSIALGITKKSHLDEIKKFLIF